MDFNNINDIKFLIGLSLILLFALIWLAIIVFLRFKKKKSLTYLLFFSIFYIYLFKVLDYTLFQFQFQFLQYLMPGRLVLRGYALGENMNIIPLITLTADDLKTSLLNISLFIPFGFWSPFITNFHMKKVLTMGVLFSIIIELLQLASALITNITFRIVDVNDLIFNASGAAIGYMLFIGFIHIYRQIFRNYKGSAAPILRYITERPQLRNKHF